MYFLSKNKEIYDQTIKNKIRPRAMNYFSENRYVDHIENLEGSPLGCMGLLGEIKECLFTIALYENHPIELIKQYASNAAKLRILEASVSYDNEFQPFYCYGYNISNERFYALMSDDEQIIHWLIKNKNKIARSEMPSKRISESDYNPIMLYTTLLAIEGKEWMNVSERSQILLDRKLPYGKKRIPDLKFLISLANQDIKGMKNALDKLLMPRRNAKIAAYDTLPFLDFYLQPQVLFYGKLASRHGFDLGIDDEIAPKELIEYAPLESYPNAYRFMDEYDWDAPFEFQHQWIEKYAHTKKITKTTEEVLAEHRKLCKKYNAEESKFSIKKLTYKILTKQGDQQVGNQPFRYPYCYNRVIWHGQEKVYDGLYTHPKDKSLRIVEPTLAVQENNTYELPLAEGGNPQFSPAWFQSLESRLVESDEVKLTLENARLQKQAIQTEVAYMKNDSNEVAFLPVKIRTPKEA